MVFVKWTKVLSVGIKEIDELYIKADKLRKENRRIQFESLKEEFEKEGNYESYNK
jgi:hypothetical protein